MLLLHCLCSAVMNGALKFASIPDIPMLYVSERGSAALWFARGSFLLLIEWFHIPLWSHLLYVECNFLFFFPFSLAFSIIQFFLVSRVDHLDVPFVEFIKILLPIKKNKKLPRNKVQPIPPHTKRCGLQKFCS